MPNETKNIKIVKRHFHTFDALRFFACFKVFLHHIPIIIFPWFVVLKAGGGIGVQFFFVLSGFLITYIILEEKKQTGTLSLKNFFLRRVLRIWPLFYLAIVIAFTTPLILGIVHLNSSVDGYQPDWLMSVLFLENYKMMMTHTNPNVSPLGVMWSLCIEEHFYIIWGLLLFFLPVKRILWLVLCCVIAGPACRMIYTMNGIPTIDVFTNIDLFAYGAIPAYLLISDSGGVERIVGKIKLLWKRLFVVFVIAIVVVLSQPHSDTLDIFTTSIAGALFSSLLFLVLPAKDRFRISDTNILSKLGVYTYGFYIYHTLVINLLLRVFEKFGLKVDSLGIAIMYVSLAFVVSITISMLSYHLFEKQFLKLKAKFK